MRARSAIKGRRVPAEFRWVCAARLVRAESPSTRQVGCFVLRIHLLSPGMAARNDAAVESAALMGATLPGKIASAVPSRSRGRTRRP